MVIAVLLRVDGGGTTTVLCTELIPDPIITGNVVLKDVVGVSFPVAGKWLKVQQWSVSKEVVINWMVGPLRDSFEITTEMLEGKEQVVPWPPNSQPHQDLLNHPEEVGPFIARNGK